MLPLESFVRTLIWGVVVILGSTLSITVVLPRTTKGHSIGSYEEKEKGSIVINIHYLSEC